MEEKKRGQRLFGGLLSTLNQSTPNGQQKRRLEIEKRQAEKAQQQKHDDEVRRAERLASLKKTRRTEQIKYDEESVSSAEIVMSTLLISAYRCVFDILICSLWLASYVRKRNQSLCVLLASIKRLC